MLSTVACRALAITFIGLALTNNVQGSNHPISNDIVCPTNSHVSFVHNSYTYNAPLHKFTDITGSFFNASWNPGVIVNSTTGTDNVPGATRSGSFAGYIFNETLTAIEKRSDALLSSYHGKGFTFILGPSYPALRVDGYSETLRFESICSGKATYIDFITYTCSDNQRLTYTAWSMAHTSALDGLAQTLGATILAGVCPEEAHCDKH
ncbi:hypothetical protein MSAN_01959700 [Mycena sanguinolenta]|uniref:Uncharacterized protein n=1 Tax=Mycena sanguinolenta TaxID=230812 RepID=A0A8H6XMI4_9AGAR|nr:hypothetical protein MSAN_01959700 [Mycena sanguinolenta]